MQTDIALIEDILAGNRNAYAELVRRHQEKIRLYCAGIFGHSPTAEDAAQEVFIKAYQGLAGFKQNSAFGTWLYRIAINHCRDLLRKKGRNREDSFDQLHDEQGEAFEARFGTSPEQHHSDSAELAEKMLASVSEASRAVLILREIQGLSYEEIAAALNCSLDAVKSRLKRARAEIEKKFGHLLKESVV